MYFSIGPYILVNCPVNFDGRSCWPSTERNMYAYLECPSQKDGIKHASRLCMSNGKWSHSADYLPCSSIMTPNEVHMVTYSFTVGCSYIRYLFS